MNKPAWPNGLRHRTPTLILNTEPSEESGFESLQLFVYYSTRKSQTERTQFNDRADLICEQTLGAGVYTFCSVLLLVLVLSLFFLLSSSLTYSHATNNNGGRTY